jgi:hypothetical protein
MVNPNFQHQVFTATNLGCKVDSNIANYKFSQIKGGYENYIKISYLSKNWRIRILKKVQNFAMTIYTLISLNGLYVEQKKFWYGLSVSLLFASYQ